MGPETSLFTMALGLRAPWSVTDVRFDANLKEIHFDVRFKAGSRFACPCSATAQNVRMATSRFTRCRRGLIDFPAVVAGGGRWVIFEMRNERQCQFC